MYCAHDFLFDNIVIILHFFYRLLGNFLEAAKDLRLACKIDFDEQADEWLREVTPNVSLFCYFQYLIPIPTYYKLMNCYRKLSLKKNQSLDFSLRLKFCIFA